MEAFPDAPLVSYIELLRALRLNNDNKPTLTQAQLDASKPVFEKGQTRPVAGSTAESVDGNGQLRGHCAGGDPGAKTPRTRHSRLQ